MASEVALASTGVARHGAGLAITTEQSAMTSCPCGSGRDYAECCAPIIAGTPGATPETVMRSRYTAYTLKEMAHLRATLAPEAQTDYDETAATNWAGQAEWSGLEILGTEGGGPDDQDGFVEFRARYRMKGQDLVHHERSRFRRHEGRWLYVDGDIPKPKTRHVEKIGRNDPCPCGSGKKYKKCCGASA